jgi:hypothetical protein
MAITGAALYADSDQLLVAALQAEFPGVRVCTELPANLEQVLPVVQVNRFGGHVDFASMDRPHTDVDVWAASDEACAVLAGQVRSWILMGMVGVRIVASTGTGTFSAVHEQTGMMRRPSSNPDVWRRGAAYTISVHAGA